jgi:hypothetical protein
MHPTKHLCQIRDSATTQEALHGQQYDVRLGMSPLALIPQRIAKSLFVSDAGFRLKGTDFRQFFHRLRHSFYLLSLRL